jgi:tRNA-(ms[2]io[6]A)-hydroxylase
MSGPDGKRHLPVLPSAEAAEADVDDRPPWHWAAIGGVAVFVFWFPLAAALHGLLGDAAGPVASAVHAAGFGLACGGAGFLVGRFSAKAGTREAAVGGVAASALACLLAAAQLRGGAVTWALILAVFVAFGGGTAWAGGWLGVARRARSLRPNQEPPKGARGAR